MPKLIIRFVTAAVLALAVAASAAPATYTGVLTDSMCTRKHMMPGHTDAGCVRDCVKEGAKYTLVSAGKVYGLKGDSKLLDKFAGQKVTVTGVQSESVISISTIATAAD